ncbi:hypothetical protein UlMin_016913 [Ulmus minor]
MASRKKPSEGIALLSMYYDDEEDDEMEDVEEDGDDVERRESPQEDDYRNSEDVNMVDGDRMVADDAGNEDKMPQSILDGRNSAPGIGQLRPSTRQEVPVSFTSPPQQQQAVPSGNSKSRRGKLTIVDYGHDEVAMSPEAEDGEIEGSGRVMFGKDLQSTNGDFHDNTPTGTVQVLTPSNQATPQLSDTSQSDKVNPAVHDSEFGDAAEAVIEDQKDFHPLDRFLPPPPKDKCSEELQGKIYKFLELKKAGKSFNAEVRNRKDYRNPDFLLDAVRYQDIDQVGSCFSKDVFDPHGYDKSDYYDEIEIDMRKDMDRKEQERKKNQKLEFVAGGMQPGMVTNAAKASMPLPGVHTGVAAGLNSVPPAADVIPRDGRQNKKSKWDKLDGDRKNVLVQDSISTVGVQAAILSATNAGDGYMAFVQQRRREAEEKRSGERKERRS